MEIRIYQIIVPLFFVLYMIYEIRNVLLHKKSWIDIAPSAALSTFLLILAIFPDWSTNLLAQTLGFESNINAILFTLIGIISIFILKLFDIIKDLKKDITKLSIESALLTEKVESRE